MPKTIALISCGKKKSLNATEAQFLYTSPLFRKTLKYAETILRPDRIFILSAKHGLLKLDEVIEPYNETLKDKKREEQKIWANKIISQLKSECDIEKDKFIILAGHDYYQDLAKSLPNIDIHFKNLDLFKRTALLTRKLNEQLL